MGVFLRLGCFCNGGEEFMLVFLHETKLPMCSKLAHCFGSTSSHIPGVIQWHVLREYEGTVSKSIHLGQFVPQQGALACSSAAACSSRWSSGLHFHALLAFVRSSASMSKRFCTWL